MEDLRDSMQWLENEIGIAQDRFNDVINLDADDQDHEKALTQLSQTLSSIKAELGQLRKRPIEVFWVSDETQDISLFRAAEDAQQFLGAMAWRYGNSANDFCEDRENVRWGSKVFSDPFPRKEGS